jgi:hypothetical protein
MSEQMGGVRAAGLGAHAVQDDEIQRGHARGNVSCDGRVADGFRSKWGVSTR